MFKLIGNPLVEIYIGDWTIMSLNQCIAVYNNYCNNGQTKVFDIGYMYLGSQNLHLHNISTCVLENMNVVYGGDRYRTFTPDNEGAQPVETTITLNFKEMELITRERVFEGY